MNTLTSQKKNFSLYSFVAISYAAVFSVVFYFVQYNNILFTAHIVTFVILVFNYLLLLKTNNTIVAARTILVAGHVVITLLLITGGWSGTGFFWAFAYLPYIFYLPQKKEPYLWIILYFVCLLTAVLMSVILHIHLPYSIGTIIGFFLSLIVETILVFLLQISRDSAIQLAEKKIQELFESNRRLDQEINLQRSAEKTLQIQTLNLENTKRAMINLMEDVQAERDTAEEARVKDEAILSSVGEGMIFVDQDGKIVFANRAAEDLLKISERELLGKLTINAFVLQDEHGGILKDSERPVRKTLVSHEPENQIVTYARRDNGKMLLSMTTTPVLKDNKLIGVIEILRDVTKEKEIDRMKTEFISLASHQLRTPLSAIKWFTEMLLNGDAGALSNEQKEFTTNISDSTERMIELVNSLLNISRIESGRIIIDPKPTDLKELIESIIKELQVKIDEKHQTLILSVNSGLPKINLDPKLIRQVYMNLLTNAIKYTPREGEISVFVSRKEDQIISQVSDNGYGIPLPEQSRLFQKFFRATNAIKIETDGTGLGLYLIKAIIESSHGKIWFLSKEGKGSTFWFSLPVSGMTPKEGEVQLDE